MTTLRRCFDGLIRWLAPGIAFEFAEFEPPQESVHWPEDQSR